MLMYGAEFFILSRFSVVAYGTWSGIQTITRAFPYLHAGALSAYSKHVPLLDGAGRRDEAERFDVCVFSFVRCVSLAVIGVSVVTIFTIGNVVLSELAAIDWLLIGAVAALNQNFAYQQARLRAEMSFVRLNFGVFLHAGLFAVLIGILVPYLHVTGALVAVVTAYLGATVWYRGDSKRRFHLRYHELRRILVLGFAPFLLVITHFLLHTGERFVLLALGDRELLAMYGVAFMAAQTIFLVSHATGRTVSTPVLRALGTDRPRLAMRLACLSMQTIAIVAALAICVFAVFGPFMIASWIPEYRSSIPAILCTMLGMSLFAAVQPAYAILMGLNLERSIIALNVVTAFAKVGLTVLVLRYDSSPLAVAGVVMCSHAVYSLITVLIVVQCKTEDGPLISHWPRFAASIVVPVLISGCVVWLSHADWAVTSDAIPRPTVAGCLVFGGGVLLCLLLAAPIIRSVRAAMEESDFVVR